MATALGNSFQALLFEDTLHSTPVPQLVGMRGELISFGRPASRATSGRARPLVGAGLRGRRIRPGGGSAHSVP
jgi:hypothetical protein